jgi:hypothetical protein
LWVIGVTIEAKNNGNSIEEIGIKSVKFKDVT